MNESKPNPSNAVDQLVPVQRASGFTEHWWYDGSVLAHLTQTWGRVFGCTEPRPALRVWAAEGLDLD